MSRLAWLLLLIGCDRERQRAVDAAPAVEAVSASASVAPSATVQLDDRCARHDDCVAIELFVDGPLRCCVACGARAAANKTSADGFIAACVKERPTRDCPIYDCKAELLDPRCVGGQCQLAPRPR